MTALTHERSPARCTSFPVLLNAAAVLVFLAACSSAPELEEIAVDYPDGKPRFRASMADGRFQGSYTRYHPNGNLAFEANYDAGELDGPWTSWYADEQIAEQGSASAGRKEGRYVRLGAQGEKLEEAHYAAGEPHGRQTTWKANGSCTESEWESGHQLSQLELNAKGLKVVEVHYVDGRQVRRTFFHADGSNAGIYALDRMGRSGLGETWFPNHQLRERSNWKANKRHGPTERFKANGSPVQSGAYEHGKKEGPWTEWLESGDVVTSTFTADQRTGLCQRHTAEGQLVDVGTFQAGRRQGLWATFDREGHKESEGHYELDQKVGHWTTWKAFVTQAGDKVMRVAEQDWVDGKKHGAYVRREKQGAVLEQGRFEAGRKIGLWTTFRRSGTKMEAGSFVKGKRHGTWILFHDSGQTGAEREYAGGELTGPVRRWNKAGQLIAEGHFLAGKKSGEWRTWNSTGELDPEQSGHYEAGSRVRALDDE